MNQVLITHAFDKMLRKLWSVNIADINTVLQKYLAGTWDTVELYEEDWLIVLKCYLLGTKVRCVVAFQKEIGIFMPLYIVRKETPEGRNITGKQGPFFAKIIRKYQDKDIAQNLYTLQILDLNLKK